jgi:hypothetical protein
MNNNKDLRLWFNVISKTLLGLDITGDGKQLYWVDDNVHSAVAPILPGPTLPGYTMVRTNCQDPSDYLRADEIKQ